MNTKEKGDIAEQSVKLEALKRSWVVLDPVGDRLSYDLLFEVSNNFIKIQVKHAWLDDKSKNYIVDVRKTNTNQREIKRKSYETDDFDFAIVFISEINKFYVIPIDIFISYKSTISFVVESKRQRKPISSKYEERWDLIENFVKNKVI